MDYIAKHTTIRVPRLLDVFTISGVVHIVEEFIDGPILEDVWHKLSPEERHSCMNQFKDCLNQLYALESPYSERVQAVDGTGIYDDRVGSKETYGPFDNHATLHWFLCHDYLRDNPDSYPLVQDALSKVKDKKYKNVFTHGDLGPHNVIWKDGCLVFIDWERSGWLPEYWDYVMVYAARGLLFPDWWNMFKENVDRRYDDEVELRCRIKDYFETL